MYDKKITIRICQINVRVLQLCPATSNIVIVHGSHGHTLVLGKCVVRCSNVDRHLPDSYPKFIHIVLVLLICFRMAFILFNFKFKILLEKIDSIFAIRMEQIKIYSNYIIYKALAIVYSF